MMKKFLLGLIALITISWNGLSAKNNDNLNYVNQMILHASYIIDKFYVDSVNNSMLVEDAVKGMLKALDPHSTYLTPDEVKAMQEPLEGNFEGIGIRYQVVEDTVLILNTVIGGPSEKVGVMGGDRIIYVNDTLIAGVNIKTKDIQRMIRGPKKTSVNIKVKRPNTPELISFDIERDKIPVYSVSAYYMATPQVGYVKIDRFAQTTFSELETALLKLKKQGMKDLIIDLQDNGGGYLNSAVDIANQFVKGHQMIVYTEGRNEQRNEYRSEKKTTMPEGKVVVLVNEHSASASEILSGALQDFDRAVIVGRRTFGKGLVQRTFPLLNGGMIRLTVAHYYTPSGRCIQKPYNKGDRDSYDQDIDNRYKHGELVCADSIHFADSLRYKTQAGRTVYGGGGIMPEVFVPLDTTLTTPTHRNILAKGIFNKLVLQYFEKNQQQLKKKYKDVEAFNTHFEVTPEMIEQLKELCAEKHVTIDDEELTKSLPIIKVQLKAAIASDLFEQGAYYRVINQINNIYQKGLETIQDDKLYKSILNN